MWLVNYWYQHFLDPAHINIIKLISVRIWGYAFKTSVPGESDMYERFRITVLQRMSKLSTINLSTCSPVVFKSQYIKMAC